MDQTAQQTSQPIAENPQQNANQVPMPAAITNPPTDETTQPNPQTSAASSATTPPDANPQPVMPPPAQSSSTPPAGHVKKGGVNIWMITTLILLIVLIAGGAYMLGKNQTPTPVPQVLPTPTKTAALTPFPTTITTPVASPSGSANTGSVTGTLCYPASVIPAGTITAKDIKTNQMYTQNYVGSQNGGGTTYTIRLAPATYHLKFTPTQYNTVVGYYTDYSSCVSNPNGPNCTGQKTRTALNAVVTANGTVSNVNLCDYYYPSNTPPVF